MPKRPRRIVPNVTYLVTRRVRERAFRLRPEPWLEWLFRYAVARAAEESGVAVVGFATMCNHYHAVVHDAGARVPKFTKALDELIGRAVNAEQGRRDSLWEQGGPSYVPLLTREAVEDALVYSLVNPVKAGLVAGIGAWPGFLTRPAELAGESVVERPAVRFFGKRARSPLLATLRLVVPPTHAEMGAEQFRAHVAKRVKAREEALRQERVERQLGPVLGVEAVLRFDLDHRPEGAEPLRRRAPVAKASPHPAAAALVAAFLEVERAFQVAYQQALFALRQGREAVFPRGTYRLRVDYGVACQPFV